VGTGGKDEEGKGQTLKINPKHEIRNSKQIRMTKILNTTKVYGKVFKFW